MHFTKSLALPSVCHKRFHHFIWIRWSSNKIVLCLLNSLALISWTIYHPLINKHVISRRYGCCATYQKTITYLKQIAPSKLMWIKPWSGTSIWNIKNTKMSQYVSGYKGVDVTAFIFSRLGHHNRTQSWKKLWYTSLPAMFTLKCISHQIMGFLVARFV